MVLPLNATLPMPPELEASSAAVWEELESYLRDQGKDLKTVNPCDARRLWRSSIRQAKQGEKGVHAGFREAARVLVLELARHAEFDTVIAPSLFVREARISGKTASWDGVERAVQVEAYGREARQIAADIPLDGAAPAASLHAVVLDAQGNTLQEAQGGLELLVSVRVRAGQTRHASFEFRTRVDLFANRSHVREGIALALAPFLPLLGSATR